VEVVILSRNDPVSGMRVFRSCQHYGLPVERGVFTRGEQPWRYLRRWRPTCSCRPTRPTCARRWPPACPPRGCCRTAHAPGAHPARGAHRLRRRRGAVLDEAERVYQRDGLAPSSSTSAAQAATPLAPGPFKPLLQALHRLQRAAGAAGMRMRTALVTARSAPAHERAIRTLMDWQIEVDEAMFLGGLPKGEFLREFEPDFFFDDQTGHVEQRAAARAGRAAWDWNAGETLWLRWVEVNNAGNDHGLAIDNVSLTAASTATPGVLVTQSGGTTAVTEGGAGDSYTVVLLTQPAADVVVALAAGGQINLGASELTFTAANWNVPQVVTVSAVDDAVFEGAHAALVQHLVASSDPAYDGLTVADVSVAITDNDAPPPVRIADIQGASHISPKAGQGVLGVPGIVTALASNGFYLQDPQPDADPETSDAIFVFTNAAPTVAIGDAVRVSGTVTEFRPGGTATNLTVTEIVNNNAVQPLSVTAWTDVPAGSSVAPLVLGVDRVAPTANYNDEGTVNVETGGSFDAATDGIDFYESLEGMLVRVNNPVTVSPTNGFGEIWVLPEGGAGATGVTARGGIAVSAADFNPERVQLDNLLASQVFPTVDVGAQLADVTGVMDYAFGNFELRALAEPVVDQASSLQREVTTLVAAADQLTVATFNVENLDPGDGALKFGALAEAVVNNLRAPDIINLEEVQDNDGPTNSSTVDASITLQMLVDAIAAAGGPTYAWAQINPTDDSSGGEPGGNIRVAFLYNTQRVDFVEGSLANLEGAAFNGSRKPLVGDFVFNGDTVTVVGNHFNSKGWRPAAVRRQPAAAAEQRGAAPAAGGHRGRLRGRHAGRRPAGQGGRGRRPERLRVQQPGVCAGSRRHDLADRDAAGQRALHLQLRGQCADAGPPAGQPRAGVGAVGLRRRAHQFRVRHPGQRPRPRGGALLHPAGPGAHRHQRQQRAGGRGG
jgi:hypothetical protein